jgi:hypothetical protein
MNGRGWAGPENRKERVPRLIPATKTPRLGHLHMLFHRHWAAANNAPARGVVLSAAN